MLHLKISINKWDVQDEAVLLDKRKVEKSKNGAALPINSGSGTGKMAALDISKGFLPLILSCIPSLVVVFFFPFLLYVNETPCFAD